MKRFIQAGAAAAVLTIAGAALLPFAASATEITVYKSPYCGCCEEWVEHMEENGFDVAVENVEDMNAVKQAHGVTRELASCHTALVDGYVVEGHVPAADVRKLLEEKPAVEGIAVPGMPVGSPGMEGNRKDPYNVVSFDAKGNVQVVNSY